MFSNGGGVILLYLVDIALETLRGHARCHRKPGICEKAPARVGPTQNASGRQVDKSRQIGL